MNTQTPTQRRQQTLRRFVGAKRDLQFVEHGSVCFLDPSLSGTSRFAKLLGAEFSILVSDTRYVTESYTNTGSKSVVVDASVVIPDGSLVRLGNEFVVVVSSEFTYHDKTKQRTLSLEFPTRNPYQSGTDVTVIAFPAELVGTCPLGATAMMLRTTQILVPGDSIAGFRVDETQDGSGIPVLGAYNKCSDVEDLGSYSDASGNEIHMYRITLSSPTRTEFTEESRVMVKAVPAYRSPLLRATNSGIGRSNEDLAGMYYVDVFGGIVFGTTDESTETLSVTLHDLYGNKLSASTVYKNDVVSIGQVKASSMMLWNHSGTGSMRRRNNDVVIILGIDKTFNCGVEFQSMLSLNMRMFLKSSSDFMVRLRTRTNTSVLTSSAGVLALDLLESTDVVSLEFYGMEQQEINASIVDNSKIVGYVSYTLQADIGPDESYEASGMLLKPAFADPKELRGRLGFFHLNDGTIL